MCVFKSVFWFSFASVGRYLSLVFGFWRKVIFSSSTYMKFEEFGDVVKDGKEDDGKNVGPSGPGVRKLKKKSVLRNLQLYGWLKETYWGPLATDEMEPLLRAKKGTCDCWKWRKPSKGEMILNKNYKRGSSVVRTEAASQNGNGDTPMKGDMTLWKWKYSKTWKIKIEFWQKKKWLHETAG